MTWLYLALGGAAGTLSRFALGGWVARWAGGTPWGTLAVNLLGSVLLGLLVRALPAWDAPAAWRALLTVGFCGAFTTFSTFGYEAAILLQTGQYRGALAYVLASVGLGIVGVFAGLWIGSVVA